MAKLLLCALALASLASADYSEFGIHGGMYLPTGDASDAYAASPFLGAQFLMHLPMIAVEASGSYVFLQPEGEEPDGFSASLIPLLAGIRTYSAGLFYGGGLELDIASVSWDAGEDSTYEDSESDIGAYGNVGTTLPLGGTKLELSGKAHWVDFEDIWISLRAGIYF